MWLLVSGFQLIATRATGPGPGTSRTELRTCLPSELDKRSSEEQPLSYVECMKRIVSGSFIFLASCIIMCESYPARAAATSLVQNQRNGTSTPVWASSRAQHLYGLPRIKSGDRGMLRLDAMGLSFAGKSADFSVEWHSIISVSAQNETVELWGSKGRFIRMLIPFSGGLALAAVTHHRVDELTVEFRDSRGGYHGAVFLLPLGEAERALKDSSQFADLHRESPDPACEGGSFQPDSVVVQVSKQPLTDVPAAYRALVYEHLVNRLRDLRGVRVVYREGQAMDQDKCPQFKLQVVIAGFQLGSQVLRASTGPLGMFLSPTQLNLDATFTDASTGQRTAEHFNSTVRDDSENTKVAGKAARLLARHFSSALKRFETSRVQTRVSRRAHAN